MWRVFDTIQKLWDKFKNQKDYTISELSKILDRIITRLIAFMGLIEESILVSQGLLLYFIGLQLEQAMMNISKFRSLLVFPHEEHLQYEILESLLISHESLNIYRYSYRSYLSLENVISLIILDKEYGKSLTYQIQRIKKDIDRLPISEDNKTLVQHKETIAKAHNIMQNVTLGALSEIDPETGMRANLDAVLATLSDLLHETSLAISNIYFNHSYQQKQLADQNFPLS